MPALRRLALVVAALAVGACTDSTGPSQAVDLDSALSELSLNASVPLFAGFSAGGHDITFPSSRSCAYDASSQSFVCAPATFSGITYTGGYALLSAAGTPQATFDPAATAAIRATSAAVGTSTYQSVTSTIDEHGTMTLSGLLTSHHQLDGVQVTHMVTAYSGSPLDRTMTSTITGLIPATKGSTTPYPLGGTITLTIVDNATTGVVAPTTTITMLFNGTSKVDVTISGGTFSTRCMIDLNSSSTGSCFGA
jgi:hypothetical protein